MLNQLNQALEGYFKNWQQVISQRDNQDFFKQLKPVAIGWKVAGEAEYRQLYGELREQCDRIVETWMNGRWIAKMHLKDTVLDGDIEIIKLMQRRPNSDDALGIDHVDFYHPEVKDAEQVLAKEKGIKWTRETNEVVEGYGWISIWFEGTEAKLKAATVIDIVVKELEEINAKIKTL